MVAYRRTYIRQWRERRGLSLRKLANRLEMSPGGDPLVSYASLSRIESGLQPYSQPIIEALATALNVTVPMLLESDPSKEGEIVDILQKLTPAKRRQAVAILEALAKAS